MASYQNMAMFVEVKVCIPESRVSILSPYFTAECVLLERGVLWLRWSLPEQSEIYKLMRSSPGRPVATTINDGNVLNSSKHGVNILNAE